MDRRFRIAAAAAFGWLPFVAACAPTTPETVFEWGVNDKLAAARPLAPAVQPPADQPFAGQAAAPPRQTVRKYAYNDTGKSIPRPAPVRAAPDYAPAPGYVPTPRPRYVPPAPREVAPAARSLALNAAPDEDSHLSFVWPASGPVISGFGAAPNGERNDGINIATAMDAPIRAAADGTVTYAGNELKGYGNLVLIRHAGGYTTAYAHADRVLVSRGDVVSKGQVIGYAGTTGDVTSPQLHFEIRRDTKPVNPRLLLVSRNS